MSETNTSSSVAECVAHLQCELERVDAGWCAGHLLLGCRVLRASVKCSHWSGTQLVATAPDALPHLSFLGGQRFAGVVALPQ